MKEGWEIKKLGEVCNFSQGIQVPIEEQYTTCEEGMIRFLRIIDFTQNGEAPRYIRNVDNRYVLHDKEIAIVRYGTPGFVCYGKTGAIANNLFKILPKKDIFDFSFLKYWLSSGAFQGVVKGNKYGAALQAIKFSTINEILIPIPPIAEQEKIVAELDCLSGIIEKKKQQLKEHDALAQSIFFEMFGDPVENEKGWDIKYLKEIAEFKNGLNFKKVENGRKQLFLGVSNFKDNSIINEIEEYSLINIAEDIAEEFLLKDNDIVFVRSNGSKELVGRNIIVYTGDEKITYSGFCIRCRIISSAIIPIFLNNLLSIPSIKQVIKNFGRGANISNLNQTMLGQIKVIVPPLPFQQNYISKIEAIEKQKALIKKSIEEVETLFNSRMNYYFN